MTHTQLDRFISNGALYVDIKNCEFERKRGQAPSTASGVVGRPVGFINADRFAAPMLINKDLMIVEGRIREKGDPGYDVHVSALHLVKDDDAKDWMKKEDVEAFYKKAVFPNGDGHLEMGDMDLVETRRSPVASLLSYIRNAQFNKAPHEALIDLHLNIYDQDFVDELKPDETYGDGIERMKRESKPEDFAIGCPVVRELASGDLALSRYMDALESSAESMMKNLNELGSTSHQKPKSLER